MSNYYSYFMEKRNKQIEIPLKIIGLQNKSTHIAIVGSINDVDDLLLLVDTGASNSVFDIDHEAFADTDKYEISENIVSSGFNSGIADIKLGDFINIDIEENSLTLETIVFTSMEHVNSVYKELDIEPLVGILGNDFLKQYRAVIDYSKDTLLLEIY